MSQSPKNAITGINEPQTGGNSSVANPSECATHPEEIASKIATTKSAQDSVKSFSPDGKVATEGSRVPKFGERMGR